MARLRERRDAAVVAAAAAAAFALQSIAWPLAGGRDAGNYLIVYAELFDADPVLPMLALYHSPAAPLVMGGLLDLGGTWLTEIVLGAMFVVSVLAVHAAAATAGRRVGLGAGILAALYPPYGALFHQVSSDALFAFGVACWAAFVARTYASASRRIYAAHAAAIVGLFLVRPSGLALLVAGLVPLALRRVSLRRRVEAVGAFAATAGVLLTGWAALNDARYGSFAIVRPAGAATPFYRAFVHDRVVDPDAGPASRELARAVEKQLLTRQPYRAFGITRDEFFAEGSERMWSDLVVLSDRVWGWDSDYSQLRAAAFEGIRAHPLGYLRGVAETAGRQLLGPYRWPAPETSSRPEDPPGLVTEQLPPSGDSQLPGLSGGEPIPASHIWWGFSRPDGAIRMDWTNLFRPRVVFATPGLRERYLALEKRWFPLSAQLPARDGSDRLARVLNAVSRVWPPMLAWLVVGAAGLAVGRGRLAPLAAAAAVGVVLLALGALSVPAYREYRIPADPLWIAFGAAGAALLWERMRRATRGSAGS